MSRHKKPRPTADGLARITNARDTSLWNSRRCVCGEAFDDHVSHKGSFPCARPRCSCRNFEAREE